MISAATYALALLFAVAVIAIGYCAVSLRREGKGYSEMAERRLSENKSTDFLDRDKVDDTCDICFGKFEEGSVAVCGCGMRFHRECAELTEECPYCKGAFEDMTVREIRRPVCPVCGRTVEKNVCPECKTVIPNKDMTFECVCGSKVYAGDGYCKDCGAVYKFTYDVHVKDKRTD